MRFTFCLKIFLSLLCLYLQTKKSKLCLTFRHLGFLECTRTPKFFLFYLKACPHRKVFFFVNSRTFHHLHATIRHPNTRPHAREGLFFWAFTSFGAYALEAITFKFMEALGIKPSPQSIFNTRQQKGLQWQFNPNGCIHGWGIPRNHRNMQDFFLLTKIFFT